MSGLKATLIDVGWGDSIFLESWNNQGSHRYALVDSNDSSTLRSSYIFLHRFFEKKYATQGLSRPDPNKEALFDWVLLTHAHSDHAQGLKRILQEFGAKRFFYPNTVKFQSARTRPRPSRPVYIGSLMRFVRNSPVVRHYNPVDTQKQLPLFGDASLQILWPPRDHASSNENNNSVVLALTLGRVSFVLTGDAEADVWTSIAKGQSVPLRSRIPQGTKFFKLPHHGSANGMFEPGQAQPTPWLNQLSPSTKLGISSHVQPFLHPSPNVIKEIKRRKMECYRTDQHHHVTITTDGVKTNVEYTH